MQETPDYSLQEYVPPELHRDGYHCPHPTCGVYSRQIWYHSAKFFVGWNYDGQWKNEDRFKFAICDRCGDVTIWRNQELIYPIRSVAPRPHRDMPPEVLDDYAESRAVFALSPRASAALLRLATEKLVEALVVKANREPSGSLNDNIGILVEEGMPVSIQKAMDSLRIIGNDAVHPGMINFNDDKDTALKLFNLLNVIIENRITQVHEIEKLYEEKVPETKKEQITRRDSGGAET